MKKFALLLFYTFFLLLLGRQLEFLPTFKAPEINPNQTLSTDELRDHAKSVVGEFEGDYSVYYEDLNSGEAFGIDHNTILTAASLNKIPIVFYLYSLASERKIDLEEEIILQESDIQDYGTGVLRYEEPGNSYTLKRLAELSFKHSDNTAAHLLTIKLGEGNIQVFVNSLGMDATNIAFNETSVRDVGSLFSKFYNGELMNEPLKKELMDYMSDTEFEDRIGRHLENVAVYHKTADAENMVHDGGIIVTPEGSENNNTPFILVVMSQGITDEEVASSNIGILSKEIYDRR